MDEWEVLIPGYSKLPEGFRGVVPYLVASVVFHDSFLRQHLHPLHPLFSSQLYAQGFVSRLSGAVLGGSVRCPLTGMVATGIPSFMSIGREIAAVRDEMKKLESMQLEHKNQLVKEIAGLPAALEDRLLNSFSIEGAQVSRRDLLDISGHVTACIDALRTELLASRSPVPPSTGTTESSAVAESAGVSTFRTWHWGGAFHPVPQGWQLPRPSFKAFYYLWYKGDALSGIQPFRFLHRSDVSGADWIQASRCRRLIGHVEVLLNGLGDHMQRSISEISALTHVQLGQRFDEGYALLLSELYPTQTGRDGDKGIGTLYNRLRRATKSSEVDSE
jgi:hypothetical protein